MRVTADQYWFTASTVWHVSPAACGSASSVGAGASLPLLPLDKTGELVGQKASGFGALTEPNDVVKTPLQVKRFTATVWRRPYRVRAGPILPARSSSSPCLMIKSRPMWT